MLKIHQPYKSKYIFAFVSIGVLLLGSLITVNAFSETSIVYAAGDSRTIHDISNMQEMTQQICSNTEEGDTAVLSDTRDSNAYTVYKASDGNCWMGENLKLPAGTKITSLDSDVYNDYTLPPSSDSSWSSDDNIAQIRTGKAHMEVNGSYGGDGYGWRNGFGNYYSWCAATAMSCLTNRTGDPLNGIDATESICPKGWNLPASSGLQSFQALTAAYTSNWFSDQTINGTKRMAGYYFGYGRNTLTNDANFWPAAGSVSDTLGFAWAGTAGSYWSKNSFGNTGAYNLFFINNSIDYQDDERRSIGHSVRCVANPNYTGDIEWSESKDGNVNITMPAVITIDAASGMEEIADSSKVIEGTITATVSSNTNHTVTLHAAQPALKDPANSAEITPVSSANPVKPGNNAWGLWDGTSSSPKAYTLPITTLAQEFYNTTEAAINPESNPATKRTYYVGISISPALPAGVYATDVIITASAK